MDTSAYFYFLAASVLITLAPGPDILYLLSKSLASGAFAAIALAAGLVSGIVFHTFLVLLGVSAFFLHSPNALLMLKIFGAAYLFFLALNAFKSARHSANLSIRNADNISAFGALYRRGVLMNVLNPKVLLFFLAFLPQFVDFNADSSSLQIIFLGVTFAAQAFVIFAAVSIAASRLRFLFLRKHNLPHVLNYVEAFVLTIIAVSLLLS